MLTCWLWRGETQKEQSLECLVLSPKTFCSWTILTPWGDMSEARIGQECYSNGITFLVETWVQRVQIQLNMIIKYLVYFIWSSSLECLDNKAHYTYLPLHQLTYSKNISVFLILMVLSSNRFAKPEIWVALEPSLFFSPYLNSKPNHLNSVSLISAKAFLFSLFPLQMS